MGGASLSLHCSNHFPGRYWIGGWGLSLGNHMVDFTKPDSEGTMPMLSLIGKRFRHYNTEDVYGVISVVWLTEVDRWAFLYAHIKAKAFYVRLQDSFLGDAEPGVPRFTLT